MTQSLPDAIDTSIDGAGLLELLQEMYDSFLSHHAGTSTPTYLPSYGIFYDTSAAASTGKYKVKTALGTDLLRDHLQAPYYATGSGWSIVGTTLECWGTAAVTTSGVAVGFPKTFTAAPVISTALLTTVPGETETFQSLSATGMYLQTADASGASVARTVHWRAIGVWDGIS